MLCLLLRHLYCCLSTHLPLSGKQLALSRACTQGLVIYDTVYGSVQYAGLTVYGSVQYRDGYGSL